MEDMGDGWKENCGQTMSHLYVGIKVHIHRSHANLCSGTHGLWYDKEEHQSTSMRWSQASKISHMFSKHPR